MSLSTIAITACAATAAFHVVFYFVCRKVREEVEELLERAKSEREHNQNLLANWRAEAANFTMAQYMGSYTHPRNYPDT